MIRMRTSVWLTIFALLFLCSAGRGQQSAPELILFNGKIFTSNSGQPYVEALAIRGERIIAMRRFCKNKISRWPANETN